MGIEPTTSAWKAEVLPVNYTRNLNLEATPGFEPGIEVLQTSALPLGYAALRMAGLAGFEPTHVAVKVRCLTAWL
jgi:hypothetical protein